MWFASAGFIYFIHLRTASVHLVFKRCHKAQTRKSFLLNRQWFKDVNTTSVSFPVTWKFWLQKVLVDGLQKCVKQLWGRNKIHTHSFNLPEINTYFSCCLIHFILDLSCVQIFLKSLYSSIAGQKWTNETGNWTLNNCVQSFLSVIIFIFFCDVNFL